MTKLRPGRRLFATPGGLRGLALVTGLAALAPADALAQCTAPDFQLPPVTIGVGDGPRGIAVLDVKRDGTLDLVTTDMFSDSVTFAFGDGTGGLTGILNQPIGLGTEPFAVTVADFDRDGFDDVAVANRAAGTLQAVLLDAAGMVKLPLKNARATAANPTSLVAGDFDRDGIPDLVSVSADANGTVEFFKGNGDGTFASSPPTSQALLGGQAQDIVAGDFNRDGRLDVAVVAQHVPASPRVHLVLGNGNGGWLSASSVPVALAGLRPITLAAGDVDNDGDLDVVTADTVSTDIVVLLGDGMGALVAQAEFSGSFPTTSLELADFDGDDVLDLGVAREGSDGVSVFTGDGLGAFVDRKDFNFADDAFGIVAGDFDDDGRLDLAGSSRLADNAVLLVNAFDPSCAKPSFARAGRLRVPLSGNPWAVVSGDWDGDAIPDVAVAGNSSISTLTGDGSLRFAAPTVISLPFANSPNDRRSLVVADFDLDSRPDLATVNPSSGAADDDALSVLINTGGGTFAAPLFLPVGANPWGVVAGDFNGDGAPDLVSADRGALSLTFLPGRGDGTFGASTTTSLGVGGITAIAAGYIDADPHLDVAVTHTSGNVVRWYKGGGDGGFTLGGSHAVGNSPWSVDLGDLNGDGLPDLAVANLADDTVSVLLNTGGAFGSATHYPVGDEPHWVRIGPADTDADADLVVPNRGTHDVTVRFNNGAGGFSSSAVVLGYDRPTAAIFVDADRNGKPDLAAVNWSISGGLYVLPGDGAGGFGPEGVSPGTGSRSVVAGDFNRDGAPDLVTLDLASDDFSFLKGQGDGTFATPSTVSTGLGDPRGLGVGDFDSSGTLDVVVGGSGSMVALLRGDGAGGFVGPTLVSSAATGSSRYRIAVGDFDRDGKLDFARLTSGAVTTHYGDGAGGFVAELDTPVTGSPTDLVVLDFNRDGILDLAVSNFSANTVSLLQGRGVRLDPPFTRRTPDLVTDAGPAGLAAGDLDHDGVTDLVVGQLSSSPGKLGYFRGRVAAAPPFFDPREDYGLDDATGLQPDGVAVADVNGDGLLDALVACRGGSSEDRASVRVLLGTGDPAPGMALQTADVWAVAQRNPSVIEVADFDRNGKPDFATGEIGATFGNEVAIVLNTNCRPRRLRPNRNVSLCNSPLVPFGTQPAIQIEDDGANPIQCDSDPVAASIIPGTGTPGAALQGTTPLAPTSGVVDWSTVAGGSQLAIDTEGKRYRLEFQHPAAGLTFSRTFSLPPGITVTGPASYCATQSGLFSTEVGFDIYRWFVDGSGPAWFAPDLTIPAGSLSPGPHGVEVQAKVDTCPATANQPFTVHGDLTSVIVTPGSPISICGSCTGPTLTVAETGGGALLRKWGYRTTSGLGAPTYIPFQTGQTYAVNGGDFPGQGTYYLVAETSPECGVTTESNEVEVQVSSTATPSDTVQVLTARSTSGLNRLEWVYPPSLNKVRIRYRTSPGWLSCEPPESVAVGFIDIPDQTGVAGEKGLLDHAVTDDIVYCYSVFAEISPGNWSPNGRSVRARPFDSGGAVKWAFSMGTMALSAPGLGAGVLHAVSNDGHLHSMVKAGLPEAGAWPSGWRPYLASGPSQSRPVNVPHSPSPPSAVVYLGSQATAGNNAVAVDAGTGMGLWGQPLGKPIQAGPAGMFTAYGGGIDAILLGTRDPDNPNAFHALDPGSLNPLPAPWPYVGETGNEIGMVNAQAAVDYATDRAYFTSYQHDPGVSDSVWCVDLLTAGRCALWPEGVTAGLGHVAASPTLRGSRLYVSPIAGVDGEIEALDAADGSLLWGSPFQPNDGQIKLFMVPDFSTDDLYFSTTDNVWALRDDGASWAPKWQQPLPGASQPVFFAGTGRVYVGGEDGDLHVLDANDGEDLVAPIQLGDGLSAVGAPTVDQAGGYVYVGTDAGVVYAVEIP